VNKVILIGNLGADPEIRTTASGTRVANFSLATSRDWATEGGQRQEKTEWHKIVVWNNARGTGLVDVVEKYLKKGDRVYIEGRIEYRSYEDKKDGTTKYVTEIRAFDLMMLSSRGGEGSGEGRRAAAPAAALGKGKGEAGESFDDFPEALDEEDDDLPF
jgi:single-strand DNA-binding protein